MHERVRIYIDITTEKRPEMMEAIIRALSNAAPDWKLEVEGTGQPKQERMT